MILHHLPQPIWIIATACFLVARFAIPSSAQPLAPTIFPKSTCGMLRCDDVPLLKEQIGRSSFATMVRDSSLRELVKDVWAIADDSTTQWQDEFGIQLQELFDLATGEFAIGVVNRPRSKPGFLLLMHIGDNPVAIRALRESIEEQILLEGVEFSTELVGDTQLSVFDWASGDESDEVLQLILCEREKHLLVATAIDVAKKTISLWDGSSKSQPLTKTTGYNRVVKEATRSGRTNPLVHLYVDPISMAYAVTGGNTAAQASLSVLPLLGLKDIEGLAMNWSFDNETFEFIGQAHLLIDKNRSGIPAAIAFDTQAVAIPDWVPNSVLEVAALSWKPEKSLKEAAKLVDLFRGEETTAKAIKRRISEPLEADFETEILPLFTGRILRFTQSDRIRTTINPSSAIGLELHENQRNVAIRMLDRIANKFAWESRQVASTTVYALDPDRDRRPNADENSEPTDTIDTSDTTEAPPSPDENRQRRRRLRRRPTPTIAVVEGHLILSDDRDLLEKVIVDGKRSPFNQSATYLRVESAIRDELGIARPAYVSWTNNREVWRLRFALFGSEDIRAGLRQNAERAPWAMALMKAVDAHPLPPFDSVANYFGPGGTVITDEDNGFHLTTFALRGDNLRQD